MTAYYHGSADELALGVVLASRLDGYVASADRELEALMEAVRPSVAIPRPQAVFLCADPDDIDAAGGCVDIVYRVEPVGLVTRHDVAWYSQAQLALAEGRREQAESCARAYWSGRQYSDPACSVIEYLVRGATVVEICQSSKPGFPA